MSLISYLLVSDGDLRDKTNIWMMPFISTQRTDILLAPHANDYPSSLEQPHNATSVVPDRTRRKTHSFWCILFNSSGWKLHLKVKCQFLSRLISRFELTSYVKSHTILRCTCFRMAVASGHYSERHSQVVYNFACQHLDIGESTPSWQKPWAHTFPELQTVNNSQPQDSSLPTIVKNTSTGKRERNIDKRKITRKKDMKKKVRQKVTHDLRP